MIRTLKALVAAFGLAVALSASLSPVALADAGRLEALAGRIAVEAQARAEAYRQAPAAPVEAPAPGDPVLADLADFALAARALSQEIDARGGPTDLKCIFRGMSGDVEARIAALDAAQTRADASRAWSEIARLARQAERIAADPDAAGPAAQACEAGQVEP